MHRTTACEWLRRQPPRALGGGSREITVDLLGMAEDTHLGVRLRVLAEPNGTGFAATGLHSTDLCTKGVIDGHCL